MKSNTSSAVVGIPLKEEEVIKGNRQEKSPVTPG
jgi:hypothetical protein